MMGGEGAGLHCSSRADEEDSGGLDEHGLDA